MASVAQTAIPDGQSVAFLGPQGTYSHEAAHSYFGSKHYFVPCQTISSVFSSLLSTACADEVSYAVVPLKNSNFGPVAETNEQLAKYEDRLQIIAKFEREIRHFLLGRKEGFGKGERVQRVLSHEQALGQCSRYISAHFPKAEKVPLSSTAGAAQIVADEGPETSSVAICSAICAEMSGLDILDSEVQDAGPGKHLPYL